MTQAHMSTIAAILNVVLFFIQKGRTLDIMIIARCRGRELKATFRDRTDSILNTRGVQAKVSFHHIRFALLTTRVPRLLIHK